MAKNVPLFYTFLMQHWNQTETSSLCDREENIVVVERRRGKIELDFGLLVTFQIIRLDKTSRRKVQTIVWFE